MKNLFLVRYGGYTTDGHLSEIGVVTMKQSAGILQEHLTDNFCIVCAAVPRAEESAEVIAKLLGVSVLGAYPEFYAADEEGRLPDVVKAKNVLESFGNSVDSIIAVVSREYIESLQNSFFENNTEAISLKRGEVLKIDIEHELLEKL